MRYDLIVEDNNVPSKFTGKTTHDTSRKKGFHTLSLVSKQFGPRLMLTLVPVQTEMWAGKL
jgi:hypothetical protein